MGFIYRLMYTDSRSPALQIFRRLLETFLACVVPSALTMFVLTKKPIEDLMYAMYFAGMFICLCANGFFWYWYMASSGSWKKFLRMNLGTYAVFAAAMIAGYYITDDPRLYTMFFGIYRALEFFEAKTIVSLALMNVLACCVMLLAGNMGLKLYQKDAHGAGRRHRHSEH